MWQCRVADGPHTNDESGTCCDTNADADTSAGTNAGTCTRANRPRPARRPR